MKGEKPENGDKETCLEAKGDELGQGNEKAGHD